MFIDKEHTVLLDPNTLSEDGTASVSSLKFTDDGKTFCYSVALSGSDWNTIYFKDSQTGEDLKDKLEWIKFSSAEWSKDGKGVFYGSFPKPVINEKKDAGTET